MSEHSPYYSRNYDIQICRTLFGFLISDHEPNTQKRLGDVIHDFVKYINRHRQFAYTESNIT